MPWEVLPHARYSPDKAPSDYHLFRALYQFLANRHIENETDLRQTLEDFATLEIFWSTGLNSLESRWKAIVDSDGDYIEFIKVFCYERIK